MYGIYLGAALKANLATDLGRSENSMPMVTKTSFCLPRYFYFSELNVSPKDKIQTSHPLHVTCWSEVLKVSCGFGALVTGYLLEKGYQIFIWR